MDHFIHEIQHYWRDHKKVVIEYLGDIGFIPNLEDGSTADSFGNVYSFKSMRITSMDNANINLNYSDYKDKDDFMAYLTMRCIDKRSTWSNPNIDHLSSDEFSFESWQKQQESGKTKKKSAKETA